MSVSFKEYAQLLEAVEIASSLDEGAADYTAKLIDGLKAAIKMRAEKKALELRAKLSAEHEKRKGLRKQASQDKSQGAIDWDEHLSPQDRSYLARIEKRAGGAQGTVATQGTR